MIQNPISSNLLTRIHSVYVFMALIFTVSFLSITLFSNIAFSADSDILLNEATSPNTKMPNGDEIVIPDPNKQIQTNDDDGINDSINDNIDTDDALLSNTNKPLASPKIYSNLNELPFPTRKMRELILEVANSGDIEKFRPFIGTGDDMTMLSLGGFDGDPIEFLKSISGDNEGHEILAIIAELLESDFVLIDEGTDREVYVWPYFYAHSLEKLTPKQRVKLFRLLTYGDYQDMESFGAYIFYRIGITPKGRWRFFVAGD